MSSFESMVAVVEMVVLESSIEAALEMLTMLSGLVEGTSPLSMGVGVLARISSPSSSSAEGSLSVESHEVEGGRATSSFSFSAVDADDPTLSTPPILVLAASSPTSRPSTPCRSSISLDPSTFVTLSSMSGEGPPRESPTMRFFFFGRGGGGVEEEDEGSVEVEAWRSCGEVREGGKDGSAWWKGLDDEREVKGKG